MNVSSTNSRIVLFFVHAALTIVTLGLGVYLITMVETRNSETIFSNVSSILRDDQVVGNLARIYRKLADFERMNIIRCVSLQSENGSELYSTQFKEACAYSAWRLEMSTSGLSDLISGQRLHLAFTSVMPSNIRFFIGTSISLLLILVNGSAFLFRRRLVRHALEIKRKTAIARDLELKVADQAQQLFNLKVESAVSSALAKTAAQVSHDLRSPLTALNVAIKTVVNLPEQNYNLIQGAITRINAIANDLLVERRTQIERANFESVSEGCNLGIRSVPEALRSVVNEKQFELGGKCSLRLESLGTFEGDEYIKISLQQFSRIISNILNNGIEALQKPSDIVILHKLTNGKLWISISDSGVGMSQDQIDAIRVRSPHIRSSKPNGNGLGLGHAISLMNGLGGTLDVESSEGLGTTITLKFPVFCETSPLRVQQNLPVCL